VKKPPQRVPVLVRPKPLVVAIRHALRLPLPRAAMLMLNANRSR
jgi:hypothetical protein